MTSDESAKDIRFSSEQVTAILIDGAPNWEFVQNYEQELVIFTDTISNFCFYAESAVTGERIFGFVENLRGLRYVDPENPVTIVTRVSENEEDNRLLP